ncbi:NAD(P)-dependent alcohol dehydrogenase [Endozoicomonas sp. SCSIO W0465]|uniref:NADPH-dependent aldehyde reductase Ahr n=1 Tax=Endozoicomonas sp. SCSIO W0465 TaxID=2918516 RepID=UPI002075C995|nr:NAD(P)-dependent alcohol dehydrogenase [Endozoicomonas sp. SCSIO W0465]USE34789.1 NAD(P)-dependent alcohol dehydrogenase [Endozoicomonas sp. SCSIO W0465]
MIQAYAATSAGTALQPFEYDPGELAPDEVEIDVHGCGICHSDLSVWRNEWGISTFPFVGGHEVAGTISARGEQVAHLNIGDRVGLGWHSGYCNHCFQCLSGDHNLCTQSTASIIDHFGGFANKVRAQQTSVIQIPNALALGEVGPLLCGGITVFNPLVQFNIKPTAHIGVIGIGGLGHLALQFASAWGCEVTALTSEAKMDEARHMGAHHCINSRDPGAIQTMAGTFDLVMSTVNVEMDWNEVIATLKPKGRLHILGAVTAPFTVSIMPFIFHQLFLSGSPVGSPATLSAMMEFAARHHILPVTEHFDLARINDAFEHLESGKARYRIVLDVNQSLK